MAHVLPQPDEHGYPGRDVPGALDGQDRDDAGESAQVAGGHGPGQDGDAFGGADGAEHPAAVGVLGVALEQRDQAGQGQCARYAHDDHPDDGRPDRDVAQRVQEDGQVHQAEGDRADAEQARRPRPVARGRGDHAAGDPPDRLRGHHQPELLAAPVQHVLDERREQRAHDALADAGDQGADHQGPQHPVSDRKTQARAQLRADATEPEPDGPGLLAGRIRPGRAPARADQGEQDRGGDETGGVGERHGGQAAAATRMPPIAEPASRDAFETRP